MTDTMMEIWDKYACDSDKGGCHSYVEVYHELFTPFRDEKINFLEIGIFHGASLNMWRKFFTKARIYGVDFNPHILPDKMEAYHKENVFPILRLDAYALAAVDGLHAFTKNGPYGAGFDLIVDDGSHIEEHQIFVLKEYGLHLLKPGGIMVIEDVQLHAPNGHIKMLDNLMKTMDEDVDYDFVKYETIDRRSVKDRYDDILFVVWK